LGSSGPANPAIFFVIGAITCKPQQQKSISGYVGAMFKASTKKIAKAYQALTQIGGVFRLQANARMDRL